MACYPAWMVSPSPCLPFCSSPACQATRSAAPPAVSTVTTALVGVLEWLLGLHHAPVLRRLRLDAAVDGGGGVDGAILAWLADNLILLLGEPTGRWSSVQELIKK